MNSPGDGLHCALTASSQAPLISSKVCTITKCVLITFKLQINSERVELDLLSAGLGL